MEHPVDNELLDICREILEENLRQSEWAEIQSDDMFQRPRYCGGFEAPEMAFCFSVYVDGSEYWFQITLDEVRAIVQGEKLSVDVRHPD